MINELSLRTTLDRFYQQIHSIILSKQHPVTGLLPVSTAVTVHGDSRDAWVRDNVYSILAVWGLALAYRRLGHSGQHCPCRYHAPRHVAARGKPQGVGSVADARTGVACLASISGHSQPRTR